MAFSARNERLTEYLSNKTWYWYLLPWLFGLYLFTQLLDFQLGGEVHSFIVLAMQSVNFFLHEMAHLLTAFLPDLMTAAAGSASELLLGAGLIIGGFWGRTYFASLFGFLWFMLATQATADYMADAAAQQLPLVSFGGGDPIHDWNFIFQKLGLLEHCELIASITRATGIVAALFGLGFTFYLMIRMYTARQAAASQARLEAVRKELISRPPADRPDAPFLGGDLYPEPTTGRLAERPAPPKDPKTP